MIFLILDQVLDPVLGLVLNQDLVLVLDQDLVLLLDLDLVLVLALDQVLDQGLGPGPKGAQVAHGAPVQRPPKGPTGRL